MLLRARQALRFIAAHWKWFAGGAAALGVSGAAGAVLIAWLGLYNVAASEGHWYVIDRFLRFGMENSVEAREPDVAPPNLKDPDLIRLGAGHYSVGCAYCHGAPGLPITPVSQHMLPPPPDLSQQESEWSDQELFWLVKHGLKYTGMPGWPVQDRDDEVWAMIAFMRALPEIDEAAYRDLVAMEGDGVPSIVETCAGCHGAGAQGPPSALAPRLHGQPAARLAGALRQYRDRTRSSGIMQTATSGLSNEQIGKLADYYAQLPALPAAPPESFDAAQLARGRELAMNGVPEREIPNCTGCHAGQALDIYPRLAAQNARFIENRLQAWKHSEQANTETARIMAPIAQRLEADEIAAVAAWFASVSATDAEPAR